MTDEVSRTLSGFVEVLVGERAIRGERVDVRQHQRGNIGVQVQ